MSLALASFLAKRYLMAECCVGSCPIAKSLASHISSKGKSQSGAIKIRASVSFLLSVLKESIHSSEKKFLPEHPSDTYVFTMKMEILLEPTSNKLMVVRLSRTSKVSDFDVLTLEDPTFYTGKSCQGDFLKIGFYLITDRSSLDWGLSKDGDADTLFQQSTDKSKITRKQSKASKHGHENQKSTKKPSPQQSLSKFSSPRAILAFLQKETKNVFGLADETKSYPIGIVRNVEVHIGKLKLLEDFYVIDMEKDPTCPLLVGRGFLGTASAVIDCKKAKIVVGEGVTRSIFGVKEIDLVVEDVPYWTTLGKQESYTVG
ncbi:MAK10-like protein [Tanacetum coccineum]